MRERLTAWARKSEDAHLEESALRRQLEGGLEEIEAALERYRQLTSALGARRWKQKLQRQPTLLSDAVAGESALAEVLPRLQSRAEREPQIAEFASRLLQRLEEGRTRLTAAVNRRLRSAAQGTLAEQLKQLSAVALEPLPLPPGPGEIRLLEGHAWLPPPAALLFFLPLWWTVASFLGWELTVPLVVAFWLYFYARSGSYWLTSERLIWQQRWSDPVEVRLSAIGEGNLRVGSSFDTVTVGEREGVTLRHVPNAATLAALLSIRRRKEFRDATASRDPRRLVALLSMVPVAPGQRQDPEGSYLWGRAVLRPDFIAYFGSGGTRLLDAMTEPTGPTRGYSWLCRDEVPIPVELLLEQLLLLPEERMDAMLRKAANVEIPGFLSRPEVFLWDARALKWKLRAFGSLKVYNGDNALFGYLSSSDSYLVEQLVAQWKAR